ncbi:hypothetical protein B0H16DRAFT_1894998 [Mycena metata]|uniref:Uncharacterized protein n=1 Tax=Mycena metata TaxID=1033252 RepID=A0AAD7HQ44_9AGAR|nr:hypothetical protein B0H16DRAFT_1894998 [Mycena metata]
MLWSRHLEKSAVHQLLGHATTFLIPTLLPAAVCVESDNQQDMEPEDSEPYLNTLDSDTTITTTDTEAAGPTPPPPTNNKICSGSPVPPCRIREAVVISARHVARPAVYLKHAVGGWNSGLAPR